MTRTIGRRSCILLALVLLFALMPATTLAADEHNTHDGITFEPWESDNSLPSEPGSYYLTKDVILTVSNPIWSVPMGTVNLCLNGYGITGYGISATEALASRNYPVIRIGACATLNLYDCGTTTHYFREESEDSSTPGMAIIDSSGNESFTGGYITGGSGGDNGGGVYISEDFNFYPDGTVVKSTLENNEATPEFQKGDAVFHMYGGTIIGNYATNGGAGVRDNNGVFNMYGGRICYNASSSAAGVRVKNSRAIMTMYGGKIDNNNAFSNEAGKGGGIGIDDDDAKVVLIGGEIKNNTAAGDGGGIYIADNVKKGLTISGSPVISGNTAAGNGGGIYIAGSATGSLTISGDPNISGNTVKDSPNNVDLTSEETIVIGGFVLEDVRIPVTAGSAPFVITGALGDNATAANFTSDNSNYVVASNGTEAVLVSSSDAAEFSYTFEFIPEPSTAPEVTNTPEAGYYMPGAAIPVGEPSAEGYAFDGWTGATVEDGEKITVPEPEPSASPAPISITGTFTKLYDVNWYNDEGELIATTPVRHNEAPSYPENEDVPTKDASGDVCSYNFIGWNSDPDAATAQEEPLDAVTADANYYAVFEAVSHDWGDPSYDWTQKDGAWKCTATRVCANDEEHIDTETVTATGEVTTPAACETKGKTTYTAIFQNQAFAEQTKEVEDVDATDHVWKFAGFTWTGSDTDGYTAAVANYICENNNEHTQTAEAKLSVETTDATCETSGSVVYTATVSSDKTPDGKAQTATKTVEIAATGHNWGDPTYEWAKDNSSVTATRICANDAEHVETETAEVTSEVTTPASCESKGKTTYTAIFQNQAFTEQTKEVEDVDATDHVWKFAGFTWTGSDTDGYTAAVANYICENNNEHTQTAEAKLSVETTDATCETSGSVVYTATVSSDKTPDGKAQTATKTVEIAATGHNWGDPTYEWAKDNSSVTATRICANDAEHVETETAEVTSEVTTPAACETKGKTTYTATFTNAAFKEQSKTEEDIAALGHDWSDWKVVKEPEAGKEGERARTCSRCEETETEAIDALPVPIVYTVTEGADSSWAKGSTEGITLTVKRSENDGECFSHYKQTLIDGKAVSVSARSGSTVVSISAETLEALSTGSHTITVVFDDGEAETTLTLTENTVPDDVPETGDDTRLTLWIAIHALSIICLASVFVFGRKRIFKK